MFFLRSLRAKTLLSALIPFALILVAVTVITINVFERSARDVAKQRDTELAEISAARLSEALNQYTRLLQRVAVRDDVTSMEPDRLVQALEQTGDELFVFDGGVVAYDRAGAALWSRPSDAQRPGTMFPVTGGFEQALSTLRPIFSDIFVDPMSGEGVVVVAVPILAEGAEFRGLLAGMLTIRYSLLGTVYAEVLELQSGRRGFAFLVDGNGRVIYHRNSSLLGQVLAEAEPVARAIRGETGAVLTDDLASEIVIAGFAPVEGTGWAVITQERWKDVVGPIRGYGWLLIGLVVAGGLLSGWLVFIGTGHILTPIKNLTRGARRIAGGDFDYTIEAKTGDEIGELASEFNSMASQLQESYAHLEEQVDSRTRELSTVNAIAAAASESLNRVEVLDHTAQVLQDALGLDTVEIHVLDERRGELVVAAARGVEHGSHGDGGPIALADCVCGEIADGVAPIVVNDLDQVGDVVPESCRTPGLRSLAMIPLRTRESSVGALLAASAMLDRFGIAEVELLKSASRHIAVAIENVELYGQEQRRAEQMRQVNYIALKFSPLLTIDELRTSVPLARDSFGYASMSVYFREPGTDGLLVVAGEEYEKRGTPLQIPVDDSTTPGKAVKTGETVLVGDVRQEAGLALAPRRPGIRSELAAPMRLGEEIVGVIEVGSVEPNHFDGVDRETVEALAQLSANVIQNARLHADLEREVEDVTVLVAIGRIINSSLDINEVYEQFATQVARLIPLEWLHLTEIDLDASRARHVYMDGLEFQGRKRGEWWSLENTFTEAVISGRSGVLVGGESPESLKAQYPGLTTIVDGGARSLLSIPLITKGEVIGALQMGSTESNAYLQRHMGLAERVGNQIARAIENARLFQENRELGVLEERNRVAREIHDTLAQGFTGIVLQLEAAEQAIEETPDEVSKHLGQAKGLARESLQEARRSVWDLVPHALEERSLDDALRDEVSEFAAAGRERATFSIDGSRRDLPIGVQRAILRICQESLTNVRRHAEAVTVEVKLSFDPGVVYLEISDDGRGFDPNALHSTGERRGFGLIGMEQRARLLDGSLSLSSRKDEGTQIEVTIPTG